MGVGRGQAVRGGGATVNKHKPPCSPPLLLTYADARVHSCTTDSDPIPPDGRTVTSPKKIFKFSAVCKNLERNIVAWEKL